MEFFIPMLEDRSLKLCQDIKPNTAEGKEMQYAAVWLEDGSGIIQIGMEPRRLLKKLEEKSLPNILSMMPLGLNGHLHVIDKNTGKIIASTEENLIGTDVGKDFCQNGEDILINQIHYKFKGERYCVYTKNSGDYTLVRAYVSLWWEEIYQLREKSEIDLLTNLYNRRGFNEKMNTIFAEPEKLGCAMMIMANADNLKKFNDMYGHYVGDEYLKGIAGLL